MALKSVYLPGAIVENDLLEVTGEEHHHLAVARAELGEKVEAFDGVGRVWVCEVAALGKRATSLRVLTSQEVPEPPVPLILGLAMVRNTAFELALEKVVEVGVTRIIPFVAGRSNSTASRLDRWRRIIIEAGKQSKHFRPPTIEVPVSFSEILAIPAASRLIFAGSGVSLASALSATPVLYLIGPEGGWDQDELTAAEQAGFRKVSLGAGILRSETAAIVGAALIRHEMGDF